MMRIIMPLICALSGSVLAQEESALRAKLLRATCRVDINPGTPHQSFGTGTFVQAPSSASQLLMDNEVLVVSAGHVLSGITIRGGVNVTLPVIDPKTGQATKWGESLSARHIDFATEVEDVGLLAVVVPSKAQLDSLHFVPLAEKHEAQLTLNEEYIAIGCRDGKLPKAEVTKPLQYHNPHNELAAPVIHAGLLRRPGDSGGGLFCKKGRLVAVCSSCAENTETPIGFGLRGFDITKPIQTHRGPDSVFYPGWLIHKLPVLREIHEKR